MQTTQIIILVCAGLGMFALLGLVTFLSSHYNLDGIKSKTVGDGQYGTARFATDMEIKKTYSHVPYEPKLWRQGKNLPEIQGIVVGGKFSHGGVTALIDPGDIHLLMIGAAGVGKTANFLYPCIEYACASGMSFLCTDTKGDLFRNYAGIAEKYYGYKISILDLRNPTRSDGDNILGMVNKYTDLWLEDPENLAYKAKAEKYAKITAKTIISSGADSSSYGQNAFFYDAAEGLLTSVLLLIAEYCPKEQRHIVSVFKLIQDLLAPSPVKGKNLPETQGIVVGGKFSHGGVTALVDSGDIHLLMIGAAGVGKTANFLYPCIEYACASGMSFLCTDTKGDLFRNYAGIAEKYYGYKISILDLRNPTRSDGDNILGMVNKYMDLWLEEPENLAYKARAEKYAKITAKTIISSGADSSSYG